MLKDFELNGSPFIPLCDLLKITDITSSGAAAKYLISEGKVLVDGVVELRKRCKIKAGQEVQVEDKKIRVLA